MQRAHIHIHTHTHTHTDLPLDSVRPRVIFVSSNVSIIQYIQNIQICLCVMTQSGNNATNAVFSAGQCSSF